MKELTPALNLLPNKFKKLGFLLLGLTLLFVVIAFSGVLKIEQNEALNIFYSGLVGSLLIFALTKRKNETQLTSTIRLKSFAWTIIFGVLYAIISPVFNLILEGVYIQDEQALEIVLKMLVFYTVVFNFILYNGKSNE